MWRYSPPHFKPPSCSLRNGRSNVGLLGKFNPNRTRRVRKHAVIIAPNDVSHRKEAPPEGEEERQEKWMESKFIFYAVTSFPGASPLGSRWGAEMNHRRDSSLYRPSRPAKDSVKVRVAQVEEKHLEGDLVLLKSARCTFNLLSPTKRVDNEVLARSPGERDQKLPPLFVVTLPGR